MARPRTFDEVAVLNAAVQCFWSRGFEATSVRDLLQRTGLNGASLYNAFGDKHALYRRALDHYVEGSISARIHRCATMRPREAIAAFFDDIIARSVDDPDRKGCMLINAALDPSPRDNGFQAAVVTVLRRIEDFFLDRIRQGQADGSIAARHGDVVLARHLMGILTAVRILARVRPERDLLEDIVAPALEWLAPDAIGSSPPASPDHRRARRRPATRPRNTPSTAV